MLKLRKNSIYTYKLLGGERCYCIRDNKSGARAIFDYDKSIRDRLVNMIKRGEVSFSLNKCENRLRSWAGNISFAAMMYSLYHGLSREDMRSITVRHRQVFISDSRGNIEDCRSVNIGTLAEIGNDNTYRRITHDDEYIRLELFTSGMVEYFTYSSGLYKLLAHRGLTYGNDNFGSVTVNAGRLRLCRTYHLAYAYYTGMITEDSSPEAIRCAARELTAGGMTIDHADNNHSNNTVLNLSRMSNELNLRKGEIVTHFTPPHYAINSIYTNEVYRIEFASNIELPLMDVSEFHKVLRGGEWPENTRAIVEALNLRVLLEAFGFHIQSPSISCGATLYVECDTPEAYVEKLKLFARSTYSWTDTPNTPHEEWRQNKSATYWGLDINKSLLLQKMLAECDSGKFKVI